ncbi:TPA: AmmeMemoRadiSam system radical SAM enzyme [Candidatus Bipolaricaulota bacterium]|nr:AmmeMemoRadiSam system radical SAM enzyme [Candidatus Bipolaricaulota bacterium]
MRSTGSLNVRKPARLFERLNGKRVRCHLCQRRCLIGEGQRGFCGVRENSGGALFTLTYGALSALESRPIEIKPFFHYHPGATFLTISTWSCNLRCAWCQNHHLSGNLPPEGPGRTLSPEEVVELAMHDRGICVSFNEPTLLFEYCLDLFPLARAQGLYCCFVSNGLMTPEALQTLVEAGLDGMNVDIKGRQWVYDRHCGGGDVEAVWRLAALARRKGVHVEVVSLLVTGVSDDEDTLEWIVQRHLMHLGRDVPLHFTRYFPARDFTAPPTPLQRLERACDIAKEAGIRYVYMGNVPGRGEDTHCPHCGETLILRRGFSTLSVRLTDRNRCPNCGAHIPIVGEPTVQAP